MNVIILRQLLTVLKQSKKNLFLGKFFPLNSAQDDQAIDVRGRWREQIQQFYLSGTEKACICEAHQACWPDSKDCLKCFKSQFSVAVSFLIIFVLHISLQETSEMYEAEQSLLLLQADIVRKAEKNATPSFNIYGLQNRF